MDPIEKFVQRENVKRFAEAFESEPDQGRRATLRHLLLDEESRYGHCLEQLELVDQRITESTHRIEGQRRLIEVMKSHGRGVDDANKTLQRLTEIKMVYVDYRFALLGAVQRATL